MHKWLYRGSLVVIGIAFAMSLAFWVTLFYPFNILKINVSPLPISSHTVKAGTKVSYTMDYCKYYPMEAVELRQLQDTVTFPLDSSPSDLPVGCHKVTRLPVVIPDDIPAGDYKITVNVSYKPFPWREVEYRLETESFKVVK